MFTYSQVDALYMAINEADRELDNIRAHTQGLTPDTSSEPNLTDALEAALYLEGVARRIAGEIAALQTINNN